MCFVSAGYDHVFHHWTIDPFDNDRSESKLLNIKHKSLVQSLHRRDHYLLSGGADNIVQRWDMLAEAQCAKFQTSNSVYQLHSACHSDCVLLEVSAINLFGQKMGAHVCEFRLRTETCNSRSMISETLQRHPYVSVIKAFMACKDGLLEELLIL